MKRYKGSYTVEAAFILPLLLACICIAIETGVVLHQEAQMRVENQTKKEPLDMVEDMYRREYLKELFGELYED